MVDISKAYILRSPSQGLLTLNAIHQSAADELSDKAHGNSPVTYLAFQDFFLLAGDQAEKRTIIIRMGNQMAFRYVICDPHRAVQACESFFFLIALQPHTLPLQPDFAL